MEEKQLYAIDRLEQAKRTILLAKEEMPAARKKIEKQLQKDPNGAKDWYQTLQSQQARLLGALDSCRLSLVEMELPDLAAAALSLEKAVANFGSPPRIIPVSAIPWRLLSKECQMPMTRPHQLPSLGG